MLLLAAACFSGHMAASSLSSTSPPVSALYVTVIGSGGASQTAIMKHLRRRGIATNDLHNADGLKHQRHSSFRNHSDAAHSSNEATDAAVDAKRLLDGNGCPVQNGGTLGHISHRREQNNFANTSSVLPSW